MEGIGGSLSNKDKGPRPSRRDFLKIAGGLVATAAVPVPEALARAYESLMRQPLSPESATYFRDYLSRLFKDPRQVRHFRHASTQEELFATINVLSRISAQIEASNTYEFEDLHSGSAFLYREGVGFGNGTVLRVPHNGENRYLLVTAAHVLDVYSPKGEGWTRHPDGLDVAVKEIPKPKNENDGFLFTEEDSRRDVSGEMITVMGTDNDTGENVFKRYPAMLSPELSKHVYRQLPAKPHEDFPETESRTRFFAIPPGEASAVLDFPAKGMSGSGLIAKLEGEERARFMGLFTAVKEVSFDGVTYSLGFGHDQRCVQEVIDIVLGGEKKQMVASAGESEKWKRASKAFRTEGR